MTLEGLVAAFSHDGLRGICLPPVTYTVTYSHAYGVACNEHVLCLGTVDFGYPVELQKHCCIRLLRPIIQVYHSFYVGVIESMVRGGIIKYVVNQSSFISTLTSRTGTSSLPTWIST